MDLNLVFLAFSSLNLTRRSFTTTRFRSVCLFAIKLTRTACISSRSFSSSVFSSLNVFFQFSRSLDHSLSQSFDPRSRHDLYYDVITFIIDSHTFLLVL
ncbi:hypothetical protein GEMRC1_013933 [Eukaryota sp. GEM-RC1]